LAWDHFRVDNGILLVEDDIGSLNRQTATKGHGVSGIDAQIQNCALDLVWLDIHRP
jgi:hypothetical protein